MVLLPFLANAQAPPETVGRIEGEDISVKGQVNLLRDAQRNLAVLASGSEVTVRSGQARIELSEGGEIGLCGPAHFSVLKSGGGVTLALNSGRVHLRLGSAPPLSVYTPMIVAHPLGVADGPRDATLGLEPTGAMCVHAARGAVRLEEQLTAKSVVIPERGEVVLPDGSIASLREAAGSCECAVPRAQAEPAPVAPPANKVRESAPLVASTPAKPKTATEQNDAKRPAPEEPRWTVLMPPLTFNAASPAPPPEPSPETIVLVREARIRSAVIFSGHVAAAETAKQRSTQASSEQGPTTPATKKSGFGAKIKRFFARLFGHKPKQETARESRPVGKQNAFEAG